MKTYTVSYRQSLMDIALQELGDVSGIVELALLNNISITEDLEAGQVIKLPDLSFRLRSTTEADRSLGVDETLRPEIVKFYKDRNILLATDIPRPNRSQTIVFAPLPENMQIGDVVILNAVASSNLPIFYTSTNPAVATITGNTLTITGYGVASIIASQVGDNIWFGASVGQTINLQPPIITSGAFSKSFSKSFD